MYRSIRSRADRVVRGMCIVMSMLLRMFNVGGDHICIVVMRARVSLMINYGIRFGVRI